MDTTSNGHNAETWTQRRNELLDTSPKLDISAKFLIESNAENRHNAEIDYFAQTNQDRMDTTSKRIVAHNAETGHNAEISYLTQGRKWTQRRNPKSDISSNMNTTSKSKN
ncbi:hypothetical protein FQR65_LT00830 [Abscondita terminalis]|nr:hypothetical protein FQR65_LT00830 [Abscondita terminalis]